MQLSLKAALLNVSNLRMSLQFYQEVFKLDVVAKDDLVAVLKIEGLGREQVLVLREVGNEALRPGRGTIGPRVLAFEVGSRKELGQIEERLTQRQAVIGHRRTDTWEAVIGVDPDRIQVTVSASMTGAPIHASDWANLDEIIYQIGQ
jgi:catechol-2,3-dioxygenase